jgi:hypothetical protein
MVKEIKVKCDRCRKEINEYDARIIDFLKKQYLGQDVCEDCDLLITLATGITKEALLKNEKPEELIKRMLQNYG